MDRTITVTHGDVVIRSNDAGETPAFVLRIEPGPDQCGCATLAAVTELATAYAGHAGVDVWLAEAHAVTVLARCRGLAPRPAPPTPPLRALLAVTAAPRAPCTPGATVAPRAATARPAGGPYSSQLLATRARIASRLAY